MPTNRLSSTRLYPNALLAPVRGIPCSRMMRMAEPAHLMSPQMPHHAAFLHIQLLAAVNDRALGNSRLFNNRVERRIDLPLAVLPV